MAARLGERHHCARCSDHEVALAVELVTAHRLPLRRVAEKFEVNPRTVKRWVTGASRALRAG